MLLKMLVLAEHLVRRQVLFARLVLQAPIVQRLRLEGGHAAVPLLHLGALGQRGLARGVLPCILGALLLVQVSLSDLLVLSGLGCSRCRTILCKTKHI